MVIAHTLRPWECKGQLIVSKGAVEDKNVIVLQMNPSLEGYDANRELIVAAPNMLVTLKQLSEELPDDDWDIAEIMVQALKKNKELQERIIALEHQVDYWQWKAESVEIDISAM